MPILQPHASCLGADPGSRRTAISRRTVVLGEFGRLLLPVQQQQGGPHSRRSRDCSGATPSPLHAAYLPATDASDRQQGRKVAQVFVLLSLTSQPSFSNSSKNRKIW